MYIFVGYILMLFVLIFVVISLLYYQGGGGGGGKSQFTYVGLNSSVTECSIEIILSGMTYYYHWFKVLVKSKHICVNFFQMKVHFRTYFGYLTRHIYMDHNSGDRNFGSTKIWGFFSEIPKFRTPN